MHLNLYKLAQGKERGEAPGKLPPPLPMGPAGPAALHLGLEKLAGRVYYHRHICTNLSDQE